MGCCQTNIEAGDLCIPKIQNMESCEIENASPGDEFAEISLDSRSAEINYLGRYTDHPKLSDFFATIRSTSCSLHRTELEQSFLQSNVNTIHQLNK